MAVDIDNAELNSSTATTQSPGAGGTEVATCDYADAAVAAADHTALSNLAWTSSAHTGTASNIAGFNGAGAALYYTLSGTGTELATTVSPSFTTPTLGVASATTLTTSSTIALNTSDPGYSTNTNANKGLLLSGGAMTATLKYTPALFFASTDPAFSTETPKYLASVVGRATETYAVDTDSGMAINFFTSPNAGGASDTMVFAGTIDQNSRWGIGTETPSSLLHIYANDTSSFQLKIEQDSTGDCAILFDSAAIDYAMGIDDTNDRFKITNASDLSSASCLAFDSAQEAYFGGKVHFDTDFLGIHVEDTRSVNSAPDAYDKLVRWDFKQRTAIESPPVGGTYCGLMTLAPWSDSSGGACHQMAFGATGIAWRNDPLDDASWTTAWKNLAIDDMTQDFTFGANATVTGALTVTDRITAPLVIGNGVDLVKFAISAGITFIQAGQNTGDTTAEIRFSRTDTGSGQLARFDVYADDFLFNGNVVVTDIATFNDAATFNSTATFNSLTTVLDTTAHIENTAIGYSTNTNANNGLLLTSGGMSTTSKYTPAVVFGSTDTAFTTEDPKYLASIVGRATQIYGSDTTSGMSLDFFVSPDNGGASDTMVFAGCFDESGFFGVGLESPISPLHIYENTTSTTSTAGLNITQAGTGDALVQLVIDGVQRWVVGIDNSDSDSFKIASSADLNTNAHLVIETGGDVTIVNDLTVDVDLIASGKAAVGTTSVVNNQLTIDQSSSTGAIPVLGLDQGDANETFINYIGQASSNALSSISTLTTATLAGFVRIEINNTIQWMPYYGTPT